MYHSTYFSYVQSDLTATFQIIFHRLSRAVPTWLKLRIVPIMEESLPLENQQANEKNVKGQIVHIRKVSQKIAFFDVIDGTGKRITVVVKRWESGDLLTRITRGGEKVHVGDEVYFSGYFEKSGDFSAQNCVVLVLWSSENSNVPFVPIPPENPRSTPGEEPCKYFVNTGACLIKNCRYRHENLRRDLIEKRVEFVKKKIEKRFLFHESEVVSGSQRATVFSQWIVNKFGLEWLKVRTLLYLKGESTVQAHKVFGTKSPRPQ